MRKVTLDEAQHQVVADPDTEVLRSAASLREITIAASLGQRSLDEPFEEVRPAKLEVERIETWPVEMRYLAVLRELPFHHRLPFDRLIFARALYEGVPVVTRDALIVRSRGDLD